jgi:CheY-like chemotaxis protein
MTPESQRICPHRRASSWSLSDHVASPVDTVDMVKGFRLGVVDYITKPIQSEEVLALMNWPPR